MNWEEKLKKFLTKEYINQRDYDEFIKIRKTLKSTRETRRRQEKTHPAPTGQRFRVEVLEFW